MPAEKKSEDKLVKAKDKQEPEKKPTKKTEPVSQTKEDKAAKLAALKEKAKQLEKAVKESDDSNIKTKIKPEEEKKADTLVPIEEYLKSSIHLGTRVITPDMKPFVYKRRADGVAVFNTVLLDKKIQESADFLAKFAPEDIIVVCKRESGWKAVDLFAELTGIRKFTKKYPAGILTNSNLEDFIEAELVFICDPWLDKNALNDSIRIKIPVLSICDTNNYTRGITQILPGNNKAAKSFGIIFYLLTKLYAEKRKLKIKLPELGDWIENWDNLVPPK